jgi:type IV pilus assembly protein PilC
MMVGILALMFAMVVPTFRESLGSLGVPPEGITKAIFDIADFFSVNGGTILIALIAVVFIIFIILRTEKGKYAFDYLKLKLPLIKKVQTNIVTARFARGFGLLLSSGMDLNDAMNSVEVVLGNRYMKKRFHDAAESIRHGMSLTVAFDSYNLFPQLMIQMVQIGEKTASLEDVLTRACDFFDAQVETSLNAVVSKIQPTILLIMGGVVATLFVAVYSPMLGIMQNLI